MHTTQKGYKRLFRTSHLRRAQVWRHFYLPSSVGPMIRWHRNAVEPTSHVQQMARFCFVMLAKDDLRNAFKSRDLFPSFYFSRFSSFNIFAGLVR